MTMSDYLLLGAAACGLIVNTMAVLGIAWKGGQLLGRMDQTMDGLSEEVRMLRITRDEHSTGLARAVAMLDGLESRINRLEQGS